ncbi:adenosylmethionine decarboxylase [Armatimonas rosea]|uniref:S-adenosylmethionine decarboxylase n=1 Tax=Armatimonas rosea TaxID=685828 RepID=A0A7W9STS4_ARMRO|nr:S-adenosylmethionine decarboxylase [Armatimonas rosea]
MGVGVHVLLDGYELRPERLTNAHGLAQALLAAAQAAEMTPLSEPVVHVFPGGGVTAFLPLAESHLALHTYPERGYIAADCFTCGLPDGADRAVSVLCEALGSGRFELRKLERGG